MSTVFTSTIAAALKDTLEAIVDDDSDGAEARMDMPKFFTVGSMRDAYEDDQEYGGLGLASEKEEGAELAVGRINEGVTTRYLARTYGMSMLVTQEAIEDAKYDQVINAAKRLKLSMFLTADYDAATFIGRGWNTSYPIGDGLPLFSASHTLPGTGTFSNTMATPMSPSVAAVTAARAQAVQFVGHNGLIMGNMLEKVCAPPAQWAVWTGLLGSEMRPDSGNFSEINVVRKLSLDLVEIRRWTASTTNYFFLTDAKNGLKWKWRRRPKGKSWLNNDNEVEKFGISARWDRNCSEPRAVLGVQA